MTHLTLLMLLLLLMSCSCCPGHCLPQVNDPSKAAAGDIFAFAGVYDGHGAPGGDGGQGTGDHVTVSGHLYLLRRVRQRARAGRGGGLAWCSFPWQLPGSILPTLRSCFCCYTQRSRACWACILHCLHCAVNDTCNAHIRDTTLLTSLAGGSAVAEWLESNLMGVHFEHGVKKHGVQWTVVPATPYSHAPHSTPPRLLHFLVQVVRLLPSGWSPT